MALAVGIAWMMLKASPRLPLESLAEQEWLKRARQTDLERLRLSVWWFISMRWIAMVLAVIFVSASIWGFHWLPRSAGWPLLLGLGTLGVVNVVYMVLLHRNVGLSMLLLAQGFVDLGILAFLLHFSGGLENPLSTVVVFHVIIGGILLSRGQCYGLAVTASALFALVGLAECTGILEHHTLLISPRVDQTGLLVHLAYHPLYVVGLAALQMVILLLTAYFVTTLVQRMRSDERHLEVLAENALAGQRLLEQALETTGTGLRVLNRSLETHWSNTLWRKWFDAPTGLTAPGLRLLTAEEKSPARQCLQDGQSRVTEMVSDCHSYSAVPDARLGANAGTFQVTTAPLKDATGQTQQIVELAQDITPQKELQARMVQAGKLAALGQLAGQVAHEVNNPIGIISGKVWLLLTDCRSDMSAEIAQELGKIGEAAERVARIARGLLSFARPSRGDRAPLDIAIPIRKSLALIEAPARRIGVALRDLLPGAMPVIHANTNELEQVFLNLFLNALDAMPNGGCLSVSAQVGLDHRDQTSRVAIMVEDTGTGITPAVRERLFEPFFTTKQEGRGTGLGLSISLGLIRSHGGEIAVESEPGKGTRFSVTLPVAAAVRPEEEPIHA